MFRVSPVLQPAKASKSHLSLQPASASCVPARVPAAMWHSFSFKLHRWCDARSGVCAAPEPLQMGALQGPEPGKLSPLLEPGSPKSP